MEVKDAPLLTNPSDNDLKCGTVKKIFLIIVVALPKMIGSIHTAYSSIAGPQMSLSISELSWFNSLPNFAASIGAILVGVIIDRYGRRTALLYGMIPYVVGWFVLYRNSSITLVFAGRALTGLGCGFAYYTSTLYIAECLLVNEPHSRDRILLWTAVIFNFGRFVVYPLGYVFDCYQTSGIICATAGLTLALLHIFVPESPTWLHLRGRTGDAEWAQQKLGIRQPMLRRQSYAAQEAGSGLKAGLAKLARKDVYKPLAICSALIVLQKFGGVTMFSNYLTTVIGGVAAADSSSAAYRQSYAYSMVTELMVMMATIVGGVVLPWTGIKSLSAIAASGGAVAMTLVAATSASDGHGWLAVRAVAVALVMFMYYLGVTNVMQVVVSETFPMDACGFASVPVVLMNVAAAAVNEAHPYLVATIGGDTYLIYGVCIVAYGVVFQLCVPETVGKTLDQINERMGKPQTK